MKTIDKREKEKMFETASVLSHRRHLRRKRHKAIRHRRK